MPGFWDERYDRPDFLFGEAPNAFLARQGQRLPTAGRALAVADGEGRNGVWLAQQGLTVTSIDASPVAQDKARLLAGRHGVSLDIVTADLFAWDWPVAHYDVVAAIFIQFMGPAERRVLFDRMTAALVPGGLFLLEGYRPEQLAYATGGPSQVENLYTEPQLRAELGGLMIETVESYDAEVDEGPGHKGMSALIDVIARRPA
jgi:SAM-dependent methyltransferase